MQNELTQSNEVQLGSGQQHGNSEFIRFVLVGGINTVLSWLIYAVLTLFIPHYIAYTIDYAIIIIFSYFANSVFVFKEEVHIKKAIRFPIVYFIQYVAGGIVLYFLVEFVHIPKVPAIIGVTLIAVPLTFVLSRIIIKNTPFERPY